MLDQNTDTMWFVIGAVIVGAAIIFIANGTLPDIFASVADSFEDVASEATSVVEDIEPIQDIDSEGYMNMRWVFRNHYANPEKPSLVRSVELQLDPNTTYTFSTSAEPSITNNGSEMHSAFVHHVGETPATGVNGFIANRPLMMTTDGTGVVEFGLRTNHSSRQASYIQYISYDEFVSGDEWVHVHKH